MQASSKHRETPKLKVWDLPTRVFHWALAVSVAGALLTAARDNLLTLHVYLGELAAVLIVFRLGWGWLGNHFARFRQFLKGPGQVIDYARRVMRGDPPRHTGHNPLAGWVMAAILLVIGAMALSGLVALGGEERVGPGSAVWTLAQGIVAHRIHYWLAFGLGGLIVLHLLGLAMHWRQHRENLVPSMFSGRKKGHGEAPPPRRERLGWQVGFVVVVSVMALAASTFSPKDYHAGTTVAIRAAVESPQTKQYRNECGACHFALHPSVLPSASWKRIMGNLSNHFGEDASLDPKTTRAITAYLVAHSAEHGGSEAAYRLLHSIPRGTVPLRVTDIPYWKFKHRHLNPAVFKRRKVGSRVNCGACHRYARYGSYEDAHIGLPH